MPPKWPYNLPEQNPEGIPDSQFIPAAAIPPGGVSVLEKYARDDITDDFGKRLAPYIVRTVTNVNYNQVRFITNADTIGEKIVFQAAINRDYLIIQNRSTAEIFVAFGQVANNLIGIEIAAGESYEPIRAPVNSVRIIGSAVGGEQAVVLIQGLV